MMRLIDETVDTFRHFCSRNSCENQCRAHAGLGEMQTVKPGAASLWRPACAYRVELRFLGPSAAWTVRLNDQVTQAASCGALCDRRFGARDVLDARLLRASSRKDWRLMPVRRRQVSRFSITFASHQAGTETFAEVYVQR